MEVATFAGFDQPIVTMFHEAGVFYEAEDYHQDYYKKNSIQYKFYRSNSGRDQFLKETWGDDLDINTEAAESKSRESQESLKEKLTHMQ